jgi:hypothetical protein
MNKRLLILCQSDDSTAFSIANYCKVNSIPYYIVTDEELGCAPHWEVHSLNNYNFWKIILKNGVEISEKTVSLIYCRLKSVHVQSFGTPTDTQYAQVEFQALISGWLKHTHYCMLNPINPVTLANDSQNPLLPYYHLMQSGLPVINLSYLTKPALIGSSNNVDNQSFNLKIPKPSFSYEKLINEQSYTTIIGSQIIGPLAEQFKSPLLKLKDLIKASVFRVNFQKNANHQWKATSINLIPQLNDPIEIQALGDYIRKTMQSKS